MKSVSKIFAAALLTLALFSGGARGFILDEEILSYESFDPLAPRDVLGPLHQMRRVNDMDFAGRYRYRYAYYFKAPEQLMLQPAYVAALQRDLRRLGYYCGPTNGIFSNDVSDAIARMQKNYSMRVTGTLTDPVRRALNLP